MTPRRRRPEAAPTPARPLSRAWALATLPAEQFDIVVVGGGITGAYTALDAARRGLKVALVEKDDLASGTSSKSSKMVHGGIRYIEQGDLALVRHSLLERQRLRENAPHLVQRLPFLFPIMKVGGVFGARLRHGFAGMLTTYHLSGGWREGKRHEALTAEQTLARCSSLRSEHLLSGYVYYDARTDDARLTLAVARTATTYGAVLTNYSRVTDVVRERGRVAGVELEADGRTIRIAARCVIMATGVWLRDFSGAEADAQAPTIRPAKGVHIAIPWRHIRNDCTVAIPIGERGSRATVSRWGDVTYLGTTDDDYSGDLDEAHCHADEAQRLLDAANRAFDVHLGLDDIVGSMAGFRPLLSMPGGATAELRRSHEIRVDADGLVTVAGGKLTTARHMAELAVDAASRVLGLRTRSNTTRTMLLGGAGYDATSMLASGGTPAHLAERYGTEMHLVARMLADDPASAAHVVEGLPYTEAEVRHAARFELACTVDDVLSRRLRARFLARDASERAAARVGELLADELGYSDAERERQVASYLTAIAHERRQLHSPATPDNTRTPA